MLSLPSPFALMSGPFTLLLLLPLPPPHEATTSASASTPNTTRAASRALRLIDDPLFIRIAPLLGCGNDSGVVAVPDERDLASAECLGVLETGARVLADHHQLAAAVERHHEARGRARIQGVADCARRPAIVLAEARVIACDRD